MKSLSLITRSLVSSLILLAWLALPLAASAQGWDELEPDQRSLLKRSNPAGIKSIRTGGNACCAGPNAGRA